VGYYEPVKARKFVDGKLNTFLSMQEFAGKEQERMEAKAKELAMASDRLGRFKESPTGSEEELYFQARPADTRLFAHQPTDYAPAAAASKPMPEVTKDVKPSSLKTPPKSSNTKPFVDKLGTVDTQFQFKEEPGFVQSPTLKTLQATGLKTESMDPATVMMMAMVDQLTTPMAQLAGKVNDMSNEKKPTPEAPKPSKPKIDESEPTKEAKETKSKYFYGVGHGRDGVFGVFSLWGEVGPLVVGVSKAIFQRFGTCQEADDFVEATQALKQQRLAAQPSGTPVSDVWYVVTNSKTGYYDLFLSWSAAQIHVVNVSGASVRKYRTYGEAQGYTDGHVAAWEDRPASARNLRGEDEDDHKSPTEVPVVTPQPKPSTTNLTASNGSASLYPPGILMGEDPSTGKSDELFNFDVEVSEEELQDTLCPPDLAEAMARSLINGTLDSVALPGGLNSSGELEGTSSDVGMLGEALEELVTQNRGIAGKSGRTTWRKTMHRGHEDQRAECVYRQGPCLFNAEAIYSGDDVRWGWSAVADASKQFHNFATKPGERKYLGCIHPITGQKLVYCGLLMGSASSPAISCRITNGGMRTIRATEPVFQHLGHRDEGWLLRSKKGGTWPSANGRQCTSTGSSHLGDGG
jgi:hypothetical protein